MTLSHPSKECPSCGGTGTVPRSPNDPLAKYGPETCDACSGSGWIRYVPPRQIPEGTVELVQFADVCWTQDEVQVGYASAFDEAWFRFIDVEVWGVGGGDHRNLAGHRNNNGGRLPDETDEQFLGWQKGAFQEAPYHPLDPS